MASENRDKCGKKADEEKAEEDWEMVATPKAQGEDDEKDLLVAAGDGGRRMEEGETRRSTGARPKVADLSSASAPVASAVVTDYEQMMRDMFDVIRAHGYYSVEGPATRRGGDEEERRPSQPSYGGMSRRERWEMNRDKYWYLHTTGRTEEEMEQLWGPQLRMAREQEEEEERRRFERQMLLDKRRGIKRTKRPAQEGDSAGPYLDVETGEPFLVEPGGVFCWSPSGWECVVLPPVSYWPGTNSDDVQEYPAEASGLRLRGGLRKTTTELANPTVLIRLDVLGRAHPPPFDYAESVGGRRLWLSLRLAAQTLGGRTAVLPRSQAEEAYSRTLNDPDHPYYCRARLCCGLGRWVRARVNRVAARVTAAAKSTWSGASAAASARGWRKICQGWHRMKRRVLLMCC